MFVNTRPDRNAIPVGALVYSRRKITMATHVIYALLGCNGKYEIKQRIRKISPLPFAAEIICEVEEADLNMMIDWCVEKSIKGWSIEQMRSACEVI